MVIYRGFNALIDSTTLENPFIKTPREPLHTKFEVHSFADEWFEENLGIKARSQCIFCTPDLHEAHKYSMGFQNGCVAEIYPIGDYHIIFSENVIDFNNHSPEFDNSPETIKAWLSTQNYQIISDINDIPDGFKGELMMYCISYSVKVLRTNA